MKLNPLERWFVVSPLRRAMQALVVRWFKGVQPLAAGSDLVEVGCGNGAGARMVAEHFRPRRMFLADLDPRMVDLARKALQSRSGAELFFCVGDAVALPFGSRTAHAVFGFGFLHHVPDWRRGLAEVRRVLRPGGVYYLEEYYPSFYQNVVTRRLAVHPASDRFDSQELRRGFAAAGLELRSTFELKRLGILGVGVKPAGK
jgi:ubiquinone/menaquinone biosynthesis C-methylase UbiE